jgi:hypothetical protein
MRSIHFRLPLLLVFALLRAGAAEAQLLSAAYVSASDFRAETRADGRVQVCWRTSDERGVAAFRVLRQCGGEPSESVGARRIPAHGEETGYAYAVTDPAAHAGDTVCYTLQILSRDGSAQTVSSWKNVVPAPVAGKAVSATVALPQVLAAPAPAPNPWIGNGPRVRPWTSSTPADRVRLSLRANGVYRVTAQDLATASGWDVAAITNAIATTNLALSCQGQMVAWYPETGTDFLFYAVAPATRYAPENVYWVQVGVGANLAAQALPPGAPPTTNQWFWQQTFLQGTGWISRNGYSSLATVSASFLSFAELFEGDSFSVSVPLTNCAPGVWTGTVTVSFMSLYDVGIDNHQASVLVGNALVGAPAWSGEQYLTFTYLFASTNLANGMAALQFTNSSTADISDTSDYTTFCPISCGFSYPCLYQSQAGVLCCTGGDSNTVAIAGFATNDVLVFDITATNLPGVVQPVALALFASNTWTASFPCGGTDCVYYAFSRTAGVQQSAVRGVCNVDWTSPTNAADEVILIPPEGWCGGFRAAMQPLADFRNAQGLRTQIVDVESLYDQFSYGLADPWAINAFCGAGYTNWSTHSLKYLLLAGAGSLDLKHEVYSVNSANACLIPTMVAGQQFPGDDEGMIVASDEALGAVTGQVAPDVIVGRMPTTHPQDLVVAVQKTIAYEGVHSWKPRVVLAADWDNTGAKQYHFSAGTDLTIPALTQMGRTVEPCYADNADPNLNDLGDMQLVQNGLLADLKAGAGIFHFFGHSSELDLGCYSPWVLDNTFITSVNWTNPVMGVLIGCRINRWQALSSSGCIPVYGLFTPDTGFVAGIGATGYMLANEGQDLGVALYASAASNGTLRLGDVLRNGLQQMTGEMTPEQMQCVCLTGDPALVFRQDITAMGTPVAWLTQYGLTAPNADLANGADGWPIWRESAAGANPTGYVLRVTSVTLPGPTNQLAIGFQTTATNTYQVQYKQSLLATDNWQAVSWLSHAPDGPWLALPIVPQGPVTTVAIPMTNASPSGFYRVMQLN